MIARRAGSPRGATAAPPARRLGAAVATYLLVGALVATPPLADAFAQPGQKLDPVELPVLGGGKAPLFSATARANVFVFIRADQERSLDAIQRLVPCEKELAGKGVRWVLLVSGATPAADVQAAVARTGVRWPVLVDEGDKLYDKLEVRMHPVVGVLDGKGVLQAVEPYRQLDFNDVVKARVRFLLGEIDGAALDAALNPAAAPMPGEDPVGKAMRDVKMARRLLELGQYEVAVKQAQKALEQAPVPEAFPVLGLAYARLGRCAEAVKALDQAEKALPGNRDVRDGRVLCAGK